MLQAAVPSCESLAAIVGALCRLIPQPNWLLWLFSGGDMDSPVLTTVQRPSTAALHSWQHAQAGTLIVQRTSSSLEGSSKRPLQMPVISLH